MGKLVHLLVLPDSFMQTVQLEGPLYWKIHDGLTCHTIGAIVTGLLDFHLSTLSFSDRID
jgi:hypothetical protein